MFQLLLASVVAASFQGAPLKASPPLEVPGGPAKFDFMNVDATDRLVFACHPGSSSFAVVDLRKGTVKSVSAGLEVNGIDADAKRHRVYAAGPGRTLVEFEMKTWTQVGSQKLDGPGDSVVTDPKAGLVYVDNDDGTSLWIMDANNLSIKRTVTIKEAPEVLVFDQAHGKLFQNIKTSNSIQVIDPKSAKVLAEYTLGELKSPHGLALDAQAQLLFSVGKNGKLVVLAANSGKILGTIDVTKNSDQIAYDPGLRRLYIPGSGVLQVLRMGPAGGTILGSVPLPASCHSVVVDPVTHDVWVAYSDNSGSFVQKFSPTK